MSNSNDFERDPRACLNLFWSQTQSQSIPIDSFGPYIGDNSISNDISQSCVKEFLKMYSSKASIFACACCGIKIIGYTPCVYKINDVQFLAAPENLVPGRTYYMHQGKSFFLYPSLITDDYFYACEICDRSLSKAQVPKISLANNIDFGIISHLPQDLNVLEKMLISKLLIFGKILKIAPSKSSSMSSLKGHLISVPHEQPMVFSYDSSSLANYVKVVFVGAASQWKDAIARFKSEFKLRPDVIVQWIDYFLHLQNPYFSGSSHPNLQMITNFLETLIEQAVLSSENKLESCISSSHGEERVIEQVLITNSPSLKHGNEFFRTIASDLNITVKPDTRNLPNDFENIKSILYQAFPWLLPLGNGFPVGSVTNESFLKYLFNFYDNRFSSDQEFLFYIFNIIQRHRAALALSIKVKSDAATVQKFGAIVNSSDFTTKLKCAVQNPLGDEAKSIATLLNPLVRFAGGKIPFSPLQRLSVLPKLYSYCHFFGLPSVFFTMSPSDCDSVLGMRLSFPVTSNNDPNGLTFEIPILEDRKVIIANNPIAAARVFDILQNCVFESLLGLQRSSDKRKTTSNKETRCFGKPYAFFSVTECQGRGSLHMHALFWAGFSPIFLQDIATNPEILQTVLKSIEEMFQSSLPIEIHNRRSEVLGNRPALNDCDVDCSSIQKKAEEVVLLNNIHTHSPTCSKPPQGRKGCRMMYPQPLNPTNRCVQLQFTKNGGHITSITSMVPQKNQYSRTNIPFLLCPVRLPDNRILFFETARPSPQDQMVVCFSPTSSAALGCNTAAYPIFTRSQAKSSLFYIIKYMTKDATQIVNSLSCLIEAKKYVKQHHSTAPNTGTPIRTSQHVFTRLLNNINTKQEVSAQMAAAAVLGQSPHSFSHDTWWCFAWPFISSITWKPTFDGAEFKKIKSKPTIFLSTDTEENIFDQFVTGNTDEYASITDIDGVPSALPQHIHYLNRGSSLLEYNFYEYSGCIDIVPKKNVKENPSNKGRLPNATYDFHPNHPWFGKYVQRIRSKLCIPVIAGKPAPTFPGVMENTPSWKRKAENWTRFIIATFVPFDVTTNLPPFQTYSSLCEWLKSCSESDDPIEYHRYETICNVSEGLSVSSTAKAVSTIYRARARTTWGHTPFQTVPTSSDCDEKDDFEEFVLAKREEIICTFQDLIPTRHFVDSEIVSNLQNCFSPSNQPISPCNLVYDSDTVKAMEQIDSISNPSQQPVDASLPNTPSSFSSPPKDCLNESQLQIFNYFKNAVSSDAQIRLFVHGGPGTGKSFLITSLLGIIPEPSVLICAPTGIAASQFKNGSTIHSAFQFSPFQNNSKKFVPLTPQKLSTLRIQYRLYRFLIIDEVSMMDPNILALIDYRLQEIMDKNVTFGGLSLVLVGDFHQLPPVGALSFPVALLMEPDKFNPESTFNHGVYLFKTFKKMELTEQMRAPDDLLHINNIDHFRKGHSITSSILEKLEPLSQSDFIQDQNWYNAPVVVATNNLRHQINIYRLKQFAVHLKLPILRWFYKIPDSISDSLPPENLKDLYSVLKDHVFLFVPGAPCQLLSNINTSIGLANGTTGNLLSLTFSCKQDENFVTSAVLSASPGEIIDCPIPFVVTAVFNGLIVPLQLTEMESTKLKGKSIPLRAFPLTLSYSITYHKIQGKTLDRVILALGTDETKQIGFSEFFVGFTRVRKSEHMRVLSCKNLSFLIGKSQDPILLKWESSYDSSGYFLPPSSLIASRKRPR